MRVAPDLHFLEDLAIPLEKANAARDPFNGHVSLASHRLPCKDSQYRAWQPIAGLCVACQIVPFPAVVLPPKQIVLSDFEESVVRMREWQHKR